MLSFLNVLCSYPELLWMEKLSELKICQQEELLSLEGILIHKDLLQLNIQSEFLGKGAQLTIY